MENSFLISKKIDDKSCFVFIKNSKKFLIASNFHLKLFDDFYKISKKDLLKNISIKFPNSSTNDIYSELEELLNNSVSISVKPEMNYVIPKHLRSFKFKIGTSFTTIYYDDLEIINTVIGQLFHLENSTSHKSINYYVFKNNGRYFLNNDKENLGSWNKKEIHYLTGKLISLIMCDFHEIHEEKWSGFLHASAVSKANNAFIIVGKSGNGKSTSSAILSNFGYNLLCDDITPISRDGQIGNFPNSISIKEPSFEKIHLLFNKKKLSHTINISKGKIKYLNPHGLSNFSPSTIKCSNIIWIKYDPAKESSIERLELKNILPLIVNESFFPTNLKSVKGFMNWFVKCNCYKIIYNNDESLIDFFEEINGFASS